MTLRAPENRSVLSWCFDGLNLKTVVLLVVTMCGGYWTLTMRVSMAEAKIDDHTRRLDVQRDVMKAKVSKDEYDANQRHIAEELGAIREATGRIEDILMERHNP